MPIQTRFKGLEGETLSQLTIKQNDMIQVRHEVGTANDSDKGLPFSVLQSIPIAVCISAASETNKTATVDNFEDFEIQNGREVIVYMANANTATNPTLTINGVGFAAMESGIWQAGSFIKCKYVSINVSGSQITRWLVDAGAYNTTTQLNGALANYGKIVAKGVQSSIPQTIQIPIDNNTIYLVSVTADGSLYYCFGSYIFTLNGSPNYIQYQGGNLVVSVPAFSSFSIMQLL